MHAHWFPGHDTRLPLVIGMLHAPPLAGAPRCAAGLGATVDHVLRDAQALSDGGVHALLLENFGDDPFLPGRVPASVIAQLTRIAVEVRRRFELPLGVNVLRNDGESALAVAHAAGAAFIRVNVLCGARVTDQGIVTGQAHAIVRDRVLLGAVDVRIFADVQVKHSGPLGPGRPMEDEIRDHFSRGHADAVIVSGSATGRAVRVDDVIQARAAAGKRPVLLGSGVSSANASELAQHCNGFIVGTAFKQGGESAAPVELARVREFMSRIAN